MSFVTARIAVAIDSGMNVHVWPVSNVLTQGAAEDILDVNTLGMKVVARGVLAVAVPKVER